MTLTSKLAVCIRIHIQESRFFICDSLWMKSLLSLAKFIVISYSVSFQPQNSENVNGAFGAVINFDDVNVYYV